jgi:hypothetical protein
MDWMDYGWLFEGWVGYCLGCPWSGLAMCLAVHEPGYTYSGLGFSYPGLVGSWTGVYMVLDGHFPAWPWAGVTKVWAGLAMYVLDWR